MAKDNTVKKEQGKSIVLAANIKKSINAHKKAAAHHEAAARSHQEAVRHLEEGNHEKAHHSSIIAIGHSYEAREIQKESARQHASTGK